MLNINNLCVQTESGKQILNNLNLTVQAGEVHALFGPNGAGKSTLSQVIAGKPGYEITSGEILFNGETINDMEPHERACLGIFLAFQYPVEIPGVASAQFLREALNARRTARGEEALSGAAFLKLVREKCEQLGVDASFLSRNVNEGFSGGEKKRFDMLQMLLLEPELCILDETDSGLDLDARQVVAKAIAQLRDGHRAFVVISHDPKFIELIQPDFAHVIESGAIAKTGCEDIIRTLEAKGFAGLKKATHAAVEAS